HDAGASRTDDAGAATNDAGVDAGPASNFDAGSPQGAVCPTGLGDAGNFASGGGDLDNSVGSTDCDASTLPPVGIPLAIEEGPFGHYNRCMGGTTDGSGQLAVLTDGDTQEYPNPIDVRLFDRNGAALGKYRRW